MPEIRRLYEKFAPQGVDFRLIYPDGGPAAVREHLQEYRLPGDALLDPQHAWTRRCGVAATPTAVVLLSDRQSMVYRGRIDDRNVDFGVTQPQAATHDLEQALESATAGNISALIETPVVGCPIVEPQ